MLAKLDEYPAVLFENLECSLGATLVTCLEHLFLLVLILDLFSRVESGSVTVVSPESASILAPGSSEEPYS